MRYVLGYRIKITKKTGTCTEFCRGSEQFSVLPPPIEVGRWYSPQVAPAAPPAPWVHSSKLIKSSIRLALQPAHSPTEGSSPAAIRARGSASAAGGAGADHCGGTRRGMRGGCRSARVAEIP